MSQVLGCDRVLPPIVTCVLVSRVSFPTLGKKDKHQFSPNSSAWSSGYLVTERMGTPSVLLGAPASIPFCSFGSGTLRHSACRCRNLGKLPRIPGWARSTALWRPGDRKGVCICSFSLIDFVH